MEDFSGETEQILPRGEETRNCGVPGSAVVGRKLDSMGQGREGRKPPLPSHPTIRAAAVADLLAVRSRDPACAGFSHCLLNYKGFLAVQAHRVAHVLWAQSRRALALQSRVAEVFAVDIHPAAAIGKGILLDHATGVVIGETAVVGVNVSILHHVTLGGTGKAVGDRHPKIGDGGAHRRAPTSALSNFLPLWRRRRAAASLSPARRRGTAAGHGSEERCC